MKKVVIEDTPKKKSGGPIHPQYSSGMNSKQFPYYHPSSEWTQPQVDVKNTLGPVPEDEASLEAEKNETAYVPDMGGLPAQFTIGGKRHSEGGTPLSLPEDSFIFSDTRSMKIPTEMNKFFGKPDTKKYTPADLAKQYDLNKYRKMLADPMSDPIQIKTAELMMDNYNKKLGMLGLTQESLKSFPDGIPVVALPWLAANGIDPASILPLKGTPGDTQDSEQDPTTGAYGGSMRHLYDQSGGQYWNGGDYEAGGTFTGFGLNNETHQYKSTIPWQNGPDGFNYQTGGGISDDYIKGLKQQLQDIQQKGSSDWEQAVKEMKDKAEREKNDITKSKINEAIMSRMQDVDKARQEYPTQIDQKLKELKSLSGQPPSMNWYTGSQDQRKDLISDINNSLDSYKNLQIQESYIRNPANYKVPYTNPIGRWLVGAIYNPENPLPDNPPATVHPTVQTMSPELHSTSSVTSPPLNFPLPAAKSDTVKGESQEALKKIMGIKKSGGSLYKAAKGVSTSNGKYYFTDDNNQVHEITKDLADSYSKQQLSTQPSKTAPKQVAQKSSGVSAWPGDKNDKSNASKYTTAQWEEFRKAFCPDCKTNEDLQNKILSEPQFKDSVDQLHKTYGMPAAGKEVDGKLGHRWDFALEHPASQQAIAQTKPAGVIETNKNVRFNNSQGQAPWWLQDVVKTTGAAGDLLRIHKYLPWAPKVEPFIPDATFVDPTRALASQQEQAAIQTQGANAYGNPQEFSGRVSGIQGQHAKAVADTLAQYNNENINIADKHNENKAAILNQTNQFNAKTSKELYDSTTIANQQFDNSKNQARGALRSSYIDAITNRADTQRINNQNPYFHVDPASGGLEYWTGVTPPQGYNQGQTSGDDWVKSHENMTEAEKRAWDVYNQSYGPKEDLYRSEEARNYARASYIPRNSRMIGQNMYNQGQYSGGYPGYGAQPTW